MAEKQASKRVTTVGEFLREQKTAMGLGEGLFGGKEELRSFARKTNNPAAERIANSVELCARAIKELERRNLPSETQISNTLNSEVSGRTKADTRPTDEDAIAIVDALLTIRLEGNTPYIMDDLKIVESTEAYLASVEDDEDKVAVETSKDEGVNIGSDGVPEEVCEELNPDAIREAEESGFRKINLDTLVDDIKKRRALHERLEYEDRTSSS